MPFLARLLLPTPDPIASNRSPCVIVAYRFSPDSLHDRGARDRLGYPVVSAAQCTHSHNKVWQVSGEEIHQKSRKNVDLIEGCCAMTPWFGHLNGLGSGTFREDCLGYLADLQAPRRLFQFSGARCLLFAEMCLNYP